MKIHWLDRHYISEVARVMRGMVPPHAGDIRRHGGWLEAWHYERNLKGGFRLDDTGGYSRVATLTIEELKLALELSEVKPSTRGSQEYAPLTGRAVGPIDWVESTRTLRSLGLKI